MIWMHRAFEDLPKVINLPGAWRCLGYHRGNALQLCFAQAVAKASPLESAEGCE